MKFFIVFAAALAMASAGHLHAPLAYASQHLPVIGANGVPVDTPAVQHATAAHLTHKAEAHARNGDFAVYAHAAPVVAASYAHVAPVAAYSAAHYAHAAPVVASSYSTYAHAAPVVASYAHAAPVAAAYAAPIAVAKAVPAAYPTTLGVPAVTSNGVPLETPEVVAAKSNHFAAHAEAVSRNSPIFSEVAPVIAATYAAAPVAAYSAAHYAHAAPVVASYAHAAPVAAYSAAHYAHAAPVVASYAHAAPIAAYAAPAAYPTTLGVPAVTSNGVPLETPEVVAAKANHFAAHAEASARNAW